MVAGVEDSLDAGNATPRLRLLEDGPGALGRCVHVDGVGESIGCHTQERMVTATTTQGFDTRPSMIDPVEYLRIVLDPVRLALLGAATPVGSTSDPSPTGWGSRRKRCCRRS